MIQQLTFQHSNVMYVGDLHGQYSDLMRRLDEMNFDSSKDVLVSSGDLIDRGNENLQCLALIEQPWFIPVIANHELMAIQSKLNGFDGVSHAKWIANGGQWFENLTSVAQNRVSELLDLLVQTRRPCLEIYFEAAGQRVGVVHAGIPKGLTWSAVRNLTVDNENMHRLIATRIYDQQSADSIFETSPPELDMLIVGHNMLSGTEPLISGKMVFADTGAGKGGQVVVTHHNDLIERVLSNSFAYTLTP